MVNENIINSLEGEELEKFLASIDPDEMGFDDKEEGVNDVTD